MHSATSAHIPNNYYAQQPITLLVDISYGSYDTKDLYTTVNTATHLNLSCQKFKTSTHTLHFLLIYGDTAELSQVFLMPSGTFFPL